MPALTHVSDRGEVFEIKPADSPQRVDMKPHGFWYSVDNSWEDWCADEMPDWGKGPRYEVTLGQEKILRIATKQELDAFSAVYAQPIVTVRNMAVDWTRLEHAYDGVEIAPYQWDRRFSYHWYYSWDCASGCIWRPKGVTLRRMPAP